MGSPKIYLHCQVSVTEGLGGDLIRRENPTLARPQLLEAETEGHRLLCSGLSQSSVWEDGHC